MKKKRERTKIKKKNIAVNFNKNRLYFNRALLVIFTAVLFFIVIQKVETEKLDVKIGDIAPAEIRATKDIVDERATELLKRETTNKVVPKYRVSPSIQMTMKSNINEFFNNVRDLQLDEDTRLDEKIDVLSKETRILISKSECYTAMGMESEELAQFSSIISDIINQIMSVGITEEDLEYEKNNVEQIFQSLDLEGEKKQLGISLINNTIQSNKFIDEEATQKQIEEEVAKVEPVIVKEHQVIVNKGDVIDKNSYDLIRESGLLKEETGYDKRNIFGVLILIILFELILYGYIRLFHSDIMYENKLAIIIIIIIAAVMISRGLYNISPYIMPISTAALLIAILLDIRLSILINMFIMFILSFILELDDTLITMYIMSGTIGSYLAVRQQQRNNILINGVLIGAVNILTIISFGFIKKIEFSNVLITSGYGFINGIICAILTIGSLPIWENLFQVLTPLKLLELSNPNQPLLKRLLVEAPGTYHHSIIVGNLSERAAEVIGADPLIARVGAYYHDIGKLNRPYYFKENQLTGDNPHDRIEPNLSSLIITNHVKDGIEIGKKNKLPKRIIDIIEEHHGDTMVAYFYHKAKQNGEKEVKEEDFRYNGPKPQTREAAIVMMADSTEAAVRSIKEPTNENIEEMIRNIIKGKLKDNQLEECNLTLKNLNEIANAFISVMMGIFHERIEYPESKSSSEKGDV